MRHRLALIRLGLAEAASGRGLSQESIALPLQTTHAAFPIGCTPALPRCRLYLAQTPLYPPLTSTVLVDATASSCWEDGAVTLVGWRAIRAAIR